MKTTYKVLAAAGYRGHKQGTEFQADLTRAEEVRATTRKSIAVVHPDAKEKTTTKKERNDG